MRRVNLEAEEDADGEDGSVQIHETMTPLSAVEEMDMLSKAAVMGDLASYDEILAATTPAQLRLPRATAATMEATRAVAATAVAVWPYHPSTARVTAA